MHLGYDMRIDKFLKNSRLIKRRTVAQEACEQGRVEVNGKVAKPSNIVNIGDIIDLRMGENIISVKVLSLDENPKKDEACEMYERR